MPTKRTKNFTSDLGKAVAERFELDPNKDPYQDLLDHELEGRNPEKLNPGSQTSQARMLQVGPRYERGLKFEQGPKLASEARKKTNAPNEPTRQRNVNWRLRASAIRKKARVDKQRLTRRQVAELIQAGEDGGEPSDCALGTIENAIKTPRRK